MPTLRFKIAIDGWENRLWGYITAQYGVKFPFVEGELISMNLTIWNLQAIEDNRDENQIIWTAELFPVGEIVEGSILSTAMQVCDRRAHILRFEIDTRNTLKTHVTAEDNFAFPFHEFETITMQLRVTDIRRFPIDLAERNLPSWTAWLVPSGEIVNDVIVCGVEQA